MPRHFSKEPANISQTIASLVGMVGPIVFSMLFGYVEEGLLASYGAMVVAGSGADGTKQRQPIQLLRLVITGTLAMFAGGLVGNHGWLTTAGIVGISALAALAGGFGRTSAVFCAQFLIFTIMGAGIGSSGLRHAGGVSLLYAIGSIWGAAVSWAVSALMCSREARPDILSLPIPPLASRMKRWLRSLTQFAGWQYSLRVAICMALAEIAGGLLHHQKSYWIALTVALVLQRRDSAVATRAIQRGIGTAAGALLGGFFLLGSLPQMASLLLVSTLAALRPVFRTRSYTIYSMLMTPLMLVLFGFGEEVTAEVLYERVADTGIGCAIVLLFGYFLWPSRVRQSERGESRSAAAAAQNDDA